MDNAYFFFIIAGVASRNFLLNTRANNKEDWVR